ncbi:MAG: hypothetical protein RLZZ42_722, partial [Bacteroidota bacterium]
MNIKNLFAGILVLLPFAFAAWVYPSLPPTIPIHFNMEGKADGWGSRDSVFIGPSILGLVSILVYLLMANIRKIDPKRYEGADDKVYAQFGLFMVAFLTVLSLVIILSSVNQNIPVEQLVFGIMGFAFAIMGIFMPRLKQNYMAGFRLPWTLEDEQNWEYTHSLAGKYWLYGGLLQGIIAILLQGKWIFITFMLILVVMILGPLIHS